MRRISCLALMIIVLSVGCGPQTTKPSPAFDKVHPIAEKLTTLSLSEVRPTGWLLDQMKLDLEGFVGNLDSLVPELVVKDDIYGKDRLTKKIRNKEVGAIGDPGEWQVQFLWWNSETQSNWWDGFIRNVILTDSPVHLEKAAAYVERILDTQDADGYLGIYDRELRYHFDNENGELWSKATVLRGLMAWYEYKGDKRILKAIEKAADNIMENYPAYGSHPFYSIKPDVGGLSHGLAITDVFEQLGRLTGNHEYNDYCSFLYEDFSEQILNEDAQYSKLLNTTLPLRGHGAHTYEHLRSLASAYYASGNPSLKSALKNFLGKIEDASAPSGGPVGDEWILGRKADATQTGYEYCSIHELMHSYISLLSKSGDADFGDKVERMFFNAAQGARDPRHSAIAYLKTDNSFFMTGKRNNDTLPRNQTRYKYSPVHQDAAVCCVPNAGRITPYFVQGMWMKDSEGLVATLLGPSEVTTEWAGDELLIREVTDYPSDNTIRFEVESASKGGFKLRVRKPGWVSNVRSSRAYQLSGGYLVFSIDQPHSEIEISFESLAKVNKTSGGEHYFSCGPLVYAYPIGSTEKITKVHRVPGFFDYQYTPVQESHLEFTEDSGKPFMVGNELKVVLRDGKTGILQDVALVPMGKTILRQVTF